MVLRLQAVGSWIGAGYGRYKRETARRLLLQLIY